MKPEEPLTQVALYFDESVHIHDFYFANIVSLSFFVGSPVDVSVAVAVACLEQLPDAFLVANGARLAFGIRGLRHLLTGAWARPSSVFPPIGGSRRRSPRASFAPDCPPNCVPNLNSRPRGGIDVADAADARLSRDTRRRVPDARQTSRHGRYREYREKMRPGANRQRATRSLRNAVEKITRCLFRADFLP